MLQKPILSDEEKIGLIVRYSKERIEKESRIIINGIPDKLPEITELLKVACESILGVSSHILGIALETYKISDERYKEILAYTDKKIPTNIIDFPRGNHETH